MALDSKQKRIAVTGAGRPYLRAQFADVLKDKPWRSSAGNVYPVADFLPLVIVTPNIALLNRTIPIAVERTEQAMDQQRVLIENFILLEEYCQALEARLDLLEP